MAGPLRPFIGGFSDLSDGIQPLEKVWSLMKRYSMTSVWQKRCSFGHINLMKRARPFGQKQHSFGASVQAYDTSQNDAVLVFLFGQMTLPKTTQY